MLLFYKKINKKTAIQIDSGFLMCLDFINDIFGVMDKIHAKK
jgi:hypothetical protein